MCLDFSFLDDWVLAGSRLLGIYLFFPRYLLSWPTVVDSSLLWLLVCLWQQLKCFFFHFWFCLCLLPFSLSLIKGLSILFIIENPVLSFDSFFPFHLFLLCLLFPPNFGFSLFFFNFLEVWS
jgi:hypothetical protein